MIRYRASQFFSSLGIIKMIIGKDYIMDWANNVNSQKSICAATVLLSFLWVSLTLATTWQVEQDGSGDFTSIQPAVDASAEGDTILIGPGSYTEVQSVQHAGWSHPTDVFVNVTVENLTFIGTSADEVFIGPDVYYQTYFGPQGFCGNILQDWWRVENVTLRNLWDGMYVKGQIEVSECKIEYIHNTGILVLDSGGVTISQCHFLDCENDGLVSDGSTGISYISDCEIGGVNPHVGVLVFRSPITLINTKISDCTNYGIAGEYADFTLTGCNVVDNNFGIHCLGGSLTVDSSIFDRNEMAAFYPGGAADVEVHNSHILAAGGWFVYTTSSAGAPVTLDFINNWWGTTDPDVVAEKILDSHDDPDLVTTINYLPMEDGLVSVEAMTLDGVKALFR